MSKIVQKVEEKLGHKKAPKILVVLTSHDKLGDTGKPTGWYLPELAHPYNVFQAHKAELVIASPKGGVAPLDPASVAAFQQDDESQKFLAEHKHVWETTTPLGSLLGRHGDFDALFYPGGHGPMYDLVHDAQSQQLINEFVAAGKPVAAVCHGPAVFLDVKLPSGKHLLEGKEVAGFSNQEETQAGLAEVMPFLLEDRLKEHAVYKEAAPWAPLVVEQDGGKFVTGQNPASARGVAEALIKAIGA